MPRSNLWIPGEDRLQDHLPDIPVKKVLLKGIIRNAVYHKDLVDTDGTKSSAVVVVVEMSDGTLRSHPQYKSAFARGGVRLDQLPEQEADREMEKLADLYRKARGRPIKLEFFEDQL